MIFSKPLVLALKQTRTLYKKPGPKPKFMNRRQIDRVVYSFIYDYANVPDEKVNLYSNLLLDLLIDDTEKFGLYLDLLDEFQLMIPTNRNFTRDWQSGKEVSDWIAFNMEEQGRLVDFK